MYVLLTIAHYTIIRLYGQVIKLLVRFYGQSPPPLQGVARLAGYNPLTPGSVSRRPDFLFVQVTIALDALLMPLEGAFVLLRLNP